MKLMQCAALWSFTFALFLVGGVAPVTAGNMPDDQYKEIEKQAKTDIRSTDKIMRMTAADSMASTNDPRAVKFLQEALKTEKDPEVIDSLAAGLGRFTDPKAVEEVGKYVDKLTTPQLIYLAYHILYGFASNNTPETRDVTLRAMNNEKSPWLTVAALEAMGDCTHAEFLAEITNFIVKRKKAEWDEKIQIIPVTGVHAIAHLGGLDAKKIVEAMETLIAVLENYSDERVRFHCARVMSQLAGMEETTDQVSWWRYWVERTKQGLAVEEGEKKKMKSNTSARPSFVEMDAVGTKIVFAIDVSNSMTEKVSENAKKKRIEQENRAKEKRGPNNPPKPVPWNTITDKMALAKFDLICGIENLSDKYSFNIVVYSTESNLIDPRTTGWVQATAPNKIKFVNLVKRLDMGTMTNIHGAMLDSFRLTAKNLIAGDPATDPEGFASGADTIFFLTDGWGSWSDDSKGKVADPRRSDKDPVIGDGQFILAADILRDFRRINKFRKVVVNSVGIGNHDKELMRGFANASGGTYVDLGD